MIFRKFRVKRAFFVICFTVLFSLFWITIGFFRAIDNVLFWRFRTVKIEKPIFVIGNPRSGTTYLYNLLAYDDERFVAPKLYQTLFCSISMYKLFKLLGKINPARKFKGLVNFFNNRFERFKQIHKISLMDLEEDEAIFFFTLLSPSIFFINPFIDETNYVTIADNLSEKIKSRLANNYRRSIQRFMYEFGENKIYFCKNVMSSGRIEIIKMAFPDAKIIYLIRDPIKAIPSMIDFYHEAWYTHSPELISGSAETKALGNEIINLYLHAHKFCKEYITVKYDELIDDPTKQINLIYQRLGFKINAKYQKILNQEIEKNKNYKSNHKYYLEKYGITPEYIHSRLKTVIRQNGM